ncbi:MAG: GNAT family N-acetyltransferase [Gaiellaceae bacterium]
MSPKLGQLRIAAITQEEAEAIASWRYDPPYDFYDADADHRDLAELLDPELRGDRYFSARDASGELVGYFGFGYSDGVAGVAVGLRPDLTGRGLGLSFLEDGLAFAQRRYAPVRYRLSVAEFNARAITIYERAGFVRTRSYLHETNGGVFAFVEMERRA